MNVMVSYSRTGDYGMFCFDIYLNDNFLLSNG